MKFIDRLLEKIGKKGLQVPSSPYPIRLNGLNSLLIQNRDRIAKIKKSMEMAENDPRVYRFLYKLSADTFADELDFVIEEAVSDEVAERAKVVINSLIERTKIRQKALSWIYAMLRDGDVFLHLVIEDSQVKQVKKLATLLTFSRLNEYGEFPADKPAYFQVASEGSTEVIAEFEKDEIVQMSWNRGDGEPYGRGIFFPAITIYERLQVAERNISVRRALSAGLRLLHIIGTPDKPAKPQDVEMYKNANREALENPLEPYLNFYSNGLVDIKELQGDRDIANIDDIRHFEALLALVCGIPKAFAGREESINRDVLEEQEEDYFRVIRNICNIFENSIREIIDVELLLNGIIPESVKYKVTTGSRDKADLQDKIDMAVKMQSLGISFETIIKFLGIPNLEYETEIKRIQKQVEEGLVPYGINVKFSPDLLNYWLGGGGNG